MAAENGQTDCARLLIDSGFDKEATDNVRNADAVKTDELLVVIELLLQIARRTIACFGHHHIELPWSLAVFILVGDGNLFLRETSRVGRVFG